jgi:hypothetical protein
MHLGQRVPLSADKAGTGPDVRIASPAASAHRHQGDALARVHHAQPRMVRDDARGPRVLERHADPKPRQRAGQGEHLLRGPLMRRWAGAGRHQDLNADKVAGDTLDEELLRQDADEDGRRGLRPDPSRNERCHAKSCRNATPRDLWQSHVRPPRGVNADVII